MKKAISYIITVIITATIVGGGAYFWKNDNFKQSDNSAVTKTESKDKQVKNSQNKPEINSPTKSNTADNKDVVSSFKQKDDLLSLIAQYHNFSPFEFDSAEIKMNINSNTGEWTISIYMDGLKDDSTKAQKYTMKIKLQDDGNWKITKNELTQDIGWPERNGI